MKQWIVIDDTGAVVPFDTEYDAQAFAQAQAMAGPAFVYQMHTAVCAKVEFEKLTPAMWAAREGGGK